MFYLNPPLIKTLLVSSILLPSTFLSAGYITEEVGDSFILTYDDLYQGNVGWQDAVKRAMTTWDNAILNTPSRRVVMYARWTDSDLPGSAIASSAPILDWDEDGDGIVHSKAERIWKNGEGGVNLNTFNEEAEMDFTIEFKSTLIFDVTSNRANPTSYDLESIALHEIGHNLGFLSNGRKNGAFKDEFDFPGKTVFDTLIHKPGETAPIENFTIGDTLYVGEGDKYQLYNPTDWNPNSSMSHISENDALYPNLVMMPSTSEEETFRSLSVVELDLLHQMGWSVIPEPSMFGFFIGLSALIVISTRRRRS